MVEGSIEVDCTAYNLYNVVASTAVLRIAIGFLPYSGYRLTIEIDCTFEQVMKIEVKRRGGVRSSTRVVYVL